MEQRKTHCERRSPMMAHQLPCPNPNCQHVFSPAEVQGATTLLCPRCGTQFQFRAAGAGSAPAAIPRAKPVRPAAAPRTPPPPARPASGGVPLARPVAPRSPGPPPVVPRELDIVDPEASASEPFPDTVVLSADQAASRPTTLEPATFTDDGGPLVRPRYQPRRSSWLPYVVSGVLAVLLIAAIIVAVVLRSDSDSTDDKRGVDKKTIAHVIDGYIRTATKEAKDEHVFRLSLPDKTWTHDTSLKKHLGASVALKRADPEAWLAVLVKDFGGVKPRDADLIKEAKERLEDFFGDFLELGDRVDQTELAGTTAQRLIFKGKWQPGTCRGEIFMLSQRGLGYWLVLLAPTSDTVESEVAAFQSEKNRLALVDQRTGWREQPRRIETFEGNKLAFSLQAPDGVWERFPPLADEERIDLYLSGKFLKEKDNRKNASAMVLSLARREDSKEALRAARDWLEKKKKDEATDASLVLAGGEEIPLQEELGTVATFGNRRGRYLELRLQTREKPLSYLLLAVVPEPDKTLVISCECTWDNRLIWRQEFLDLLGTLEMKKTE